MMTMRKVEPLLERVGRTATYMREKREQTEARGEKEEEEREGGAKG